MKTHLLLFVAALAFSSIAQCQFTKTYSLQNRTGSNYPANIASTADEGFIYASATTNDELYFVRMNSDGDVLWSRKFEGMYNESSNGAIESSTGDFFISATLRDSNALNLNARHRLYKIDSEGNLIWTKDIQRTSDMVQSGAIVEVENNLFVIGNYMDESTDYCMSITKMSLEGEVHWQKTYKDPTIHLWCRNAVITNDNQNCDFWKGTSSWIH